MLRIEEQERIGSFKLICLLNFGDILITSKINDPECVQLSYEKVDENNYKINFPIRGLLYEGETN